MTEVLSAALWIWKIEAYKSHVKKGRGRRGTIMGWMNHTEVQYMKTSQ
jgi:hypothetical protein